MRISSQVPPDLCTNTSQQPITFLTSCKQYLQEACEFGSRTLTYWARLPPFSLKALMQFPRASSERLIWAPFFILLPRFWVCLERERSHFRETELYCGNEFTHATLTSGSAFQSISFTHKSTWKPGPVSSDISGYRVHWNLTTELNLAHGLH